jgi:uncharacterized protein (TIGR02421 family)
MTEIGEACAGDVAAVEFSARGALRSEFGAQGRVHVDRPLPFVVIHRFDPDIAASLALAISVTSPAYIVWPAPDDAAAEAMLDAVAIEARRQFPTFLVIELSDMPRPPAQPKDAPKLPPFECQVAATAEPSAQAAAGKLRDTLAEIEIDLRHCHVGDIAPLDLSSQSLRNSGGAGSGRATIHLTLPHIHLTPDSDDIYPQIFHDLQVAVFDAILKAACTFMEHGKLGAPAHYRALGRSSFVDAARAADEKLNRICGTYDFLMAVSPINGSEAQERFVASGYEQAPEFRYRPLTVDPDEAKQALYKIDLKKVEDPMLESMFSEKRHEIDHQLTMLSCRNSDRFRYASLMLYEPVDSSLLAAADDILASRSRAPAATDRPPADCQVVAAAARDMAARYHALDPAFDVTVEIREDVTAGMLVSGNRLYISHDIMVPAHRLEPLLNHEVGIHLLTYVNGSKQGLQIFKRGLAGYEGVQEGLGVFAEWAVGGLTRARLRLLAGRVIAVHAMTDGASFIDVFRLMHRAHGFSPTGAFNLTTRVFRSGGFAKDAIYLRGFKTILDLLAAGRSLEPYWYGKIAPQHVAAVEELSDRGVLSPPTSRPEFLAHTSFTDRIGAFRAAPSFANLIF